MTPVGPEPAEMPAFRRQDLTVQVKHDMTVALLAHHHSEQQCWDMAKERADILLVKQGLVESRNQAQLAIREGRVRVGADHVVGNPSEKLLPDAELNIIQPCPFVSRGAYKLEPALEQFLPDLTGLTALDVGASTGGFTDLMLQRGAVKVYAVDCGYGQLHLKLREDERVICLERVNARYLTEEHVPELVNVFVTDVSFISLTKILPPAAARLKPDAWMFALIKPQFEAGREHLKKGVVTDETIRRECVDRIVTFAVKELLWRHMATIPAPIKGPKGNQEFIAVFRNAGG